MSNVSIATTLVSPGQGAGVVSDIDAQTEAIIALVNLYVPGLPAIKGIRSFGTEDPDHAPIPCTMVQPVKSSPRMVTTQRLEKWRIFDLWFAVGGEKVEKVAELVAGGASLFEKLFSNNALNDLSVGPPSNHFMAYLPYWIYSGKTSVEQTVTQ